MAVDVLRQKGHDVSGLRAKNVREFTGEDAPKFDFVPKTPHSGPQEGFDYGPDGYDPERTNVGLGEGPEAPFQIEIKGLIEPTSEEAKQACEDDINDINKISNYNQSFVCDLY